MLASLERFSRLGPGLHATNSGRSVRKLNSSNSFAMSDSVFHNGEASCTFQVDYDTCSSYSDIFGVFSATTGLSSTVASKPEYAEYRVGSISARFAYDGGHLSRRYGAAVQLLHQTVSIDSPGGASQTIISHSMPFRRGDTITVSLAFLTPVTAQIEFRFKGHTIRRRLEGIPPCGLCWGAGLYREGHGVSLVASSRSASSPPPSLSLISELLGDGGGTRAVVARSPCIDLSNDGKTLRLARHTGGDFHWACFEPAPAGGVLEWSVRLDSWRNSCVGITTNVSQLCDYTGRLGSSFALWTSGTAHAVSATGAIVRQDRAGSHHEPPAGAASGAGAVSWHLAAGRSCREGDTLRCVLDLPHGEFRVYNAAAPTPDEPVLRVSSVGGESLRGRSWHPFVCLDFEGEQATVTFASRAPQTRAAQRRVLEQAMSAASSVVALEALIEHARAAVAVAPAALEAALRRAAELRAAEEQREQALRALHDARSAVELRAAIERSALVDLAEHDLAGARARLQTALSTALSDTMLSATGPAAARPLCDAIAAAELAISTRLVPSAAASSSPLQQLLISAAACLEEIGAEERRRAERAAAGADEPPPPPHEFLCPITREVMVDPVVASDGFSYERTAIAKWIGSHAKSPCSNVHLSSSMLFPNTALKQMIRERPAAEHERCMTLARRLGEARGAAAPSPAAEAGGRGKKRAASGQEAQVEPEEGRDRRRLRSGLRSATAGAARP